MATTFDPGNTDAGVTLSNGNLTAAANGGAGSLTRSTTAHSSGKLYVEFTIGGALSSSETCGVGLDTAVINYYQNGSCLGTPAGPFDTFTGTDVVSMAVDLASVLVWFRVNGGNWNANASANPATGVGGVDCSATAAGFGITNFHVQCDLEDATTPDAVTANFGASGFAHSVSSGFGAWDAGSKSYTQQFTVLGPGGYPRPPYGSFAGKPSGRQYTQQFTVLGPGGYPRPPYGSFAGKVPVTGPSYFGQRGKIMRTLSQGTQ